MPSNPSTPTSSSDVEMQKLVDKKPEPAVLSPSAKEKAASATKALYSCALYSFCSVSMVLVNKSLASR